MPTVMDLKNRFSARERTLILEVYFATKSYLLVKRSFARSFPDQKVPNNSTISRLIRKFRETGCVTDDCKGNSGRPPTTRGQDTIEDVRNRLNQSPRKSIRKLSQEVRMSKSSLQRLLRRDFSFHPYKVHVLQEQSEANKTDRLQFARKTNRKLLNEPDFLNLVLFSDETHFHLSGHVNRQNFRCWSPCKPNDHQEKPLSVEMTTVWCAIGQNGIFGPYFFEDENNARVTVNSERYVDMLRKRFIPKLRRCRGYSMDTVVFQQDGAPPHCSEQSLAFLRQYFPGDRLISRRTANPWPLYSPDRTIFCGDLKERVYQNKPRTIEDLKNNIRQEIQRISPETLHRVIANFRRRLNHVIETRGKWFEYTLNY